MKREGFISGWILSLAVSALASADTVSINNLYLRPINPTNNETVPAEEITDFIMRMTVSGARGPGRGLPATPQVLATTNGTRPTLPLGPQFLSPTPTILSGVPTVNAGGATRTDQIELVWNNRVSTPINLGGVVGLSFGGQFRFDGRELAITGAEWSRTGTPAIISALAQTRISSNRRNSFDFRFTNNEDGSVALSGLVFESLGSPLGLDQLDPTGSSFGGNPLIPSAAAINGKTVTLSSLYLLGAGDELELLFDGELPDVLVARTLTNYAADDGMAAMVVQTVVPEPLSGSMLLTALVAMSIRRRERVG